MGRKIDYYKNRALTNLSGETWRPIPYFEGFYDASNLGRIKSLKRFVKHSSGTQKIVKEMILSQFFNPEGYLLVRLNKEGIGYGMLVSRLIGLTFIPNPENKKTVNHKRGIKTDNRVVSLEWNTNKENNEHAFRVLGRKSSTYGKTGSLCHSSKKVICLNDNQKFDSATQAGIYYEIGGSTITNICNGVYKESRSGLRFQFLNKDDRVATSAKALSYPFKVTPCMEIFIFYNYKSRKESGFSLADRFGVSEATITNISKGRGRVKLIK